MFKHEDAGLMFFGELHDAMTDLMSTLFIKCAYLCPQGRIVLFAVSSFALLLLLIRGYGQRTIAKMNPSDFVITVAVGSTVATFILWKDALPTQRRRDRDIVFCSETLEFGMGYSRT